MKNVELNKVWEEYLHLAGELKQACIAGSGAWGGGGGLAVSTALRMSAMIPEDRC